MVGIAAYGGYIPRLRLQRKAIVGANVWHNGALAGLAKGERSIGNWDEDAVTMGVEAARDCLHEKDRSGLKAVYIASTSLPFRDRLCSGIAVQALNLDQEVETLDITTSQRAGTQALIAGLRAAAAGAGPVLVMAADKRPTKAGSPLEPVVGDGAAAVVLSADNPAIKLVAHASKAVDFVDHYRGLEEDFDYVWEERWIRDEGYAKIVPPVVASALAKAGLTSDQIDHFIMPATIRGVNAAMAKACKMKEEAVRPTLDGVVGECGAAHTMVMLVHAIEEAKPGDRILVASFGQGCDALIFEVGDGKDAVGGRLGVKGHIDRRKEETNYNKYLSWNGLITIEKGMRAEADKGTALSALYRNSDGITGFVGGKSKETGVAQYPKSRISVNPNSYEVDTQEDQPFADIPAKIMSWTADNLTYSPDPPAHYGMVVFEEGGRMMADFTDVDVGGVDVGMEMRMVFRVKEYDPVRGFTKYFWKAAPV